jgi:hypothetical protein
MKQIVMCQDCYSNPAVYCVVQDWDLGIALICEECSTFYHIKGIKLRPILHSEMEGVKKAHLEEFLKYNRSFHHYDLTVKVKAEDSPVLWDRFVRPSWRYAYVVSFFPTMGKRFSFKFNLRGMNFSLTKLKEL